MLDNILLILLKKDIEKIEYITNKPASVIDNQKIYNTSIFNGIITRKWFMLVTFKEKPFFNNIDTLLKEFDIDYHKIITDYFSTILIKKKNTEKTLYDENKNTQMIEIIKNIFVEEIKKTIEKWFKENIKKITSAITN